MEAKKHFKLYKSGKLWVTAAVTTVALTTGMAMHTNTASAAVNNNAPVTVNLADQATGNDSSANSSANSSADSSADSSATKTEEQTASVTRHFNVQTPQGETAPSMADQKINYSRTVTTTTGKDGKPSPQVGDWKTKDATDKIVAIPQIKGYLSYYSTDNGKTKAYAENIPAISQDITKDVLAGLKDKSNTVINYLVGYTKQSDVIQPTKPDAKGEEDLWAKVTQTINGHFNDSKTGVITRDPETVWFKRTRTVTSTLDKDGQLKKTTKYSNWVFASASWDANAKDATQFPTFEINPVSGYRATLSTDPNTIVSDINDPIPTPTNSETEADPAKLVKNVTDTIVYINEMNDPVNAGFDPNNKGNWAWIDGINVDHDSIHVVG